MSATVECFEKHTHILVAESIMDQAFILVLQEFILITCNRLIDWLDSTKTPRQFMYCQVHFTVGTSTQHSANQVEVKLGDWWTQITFESYLNFSLDFPFLLLSLWSEGNLLCVFSQLLQFTLDFRHIVKPGLRRFFNLIDQVFLLSWLPMGENVLTIKLLCCCNVPTTACKHRWLWTSCNQFLHIDV